MSKPLLFYNYDTIQVIEIQWKSDFFFHLYNLSNTALRDYDLNVTYVIFHDL